jgi:hypothetical protein
MTTPDDLTLDDARTLVRSAAVTNDPTVASAVAYTIDNDLWQGGTAWTGPRPTGEGSAAILDEIQRKITAPNLPRTLALRHVSGVIGREPVYDYSPPIPPDDSEALTSWWDSRDIMQLWRDATLMALGGEIPVLRFVVPTPPTRNAVSTAEALGWLAVEVLPSSMARVISDTAAGVSLAVAVYDAGKRTLDGLLGRGITQDVAEIVSLDDAGMTVVRTTGALEDSVALPLGGNLTMHALDGIDPLVGQPILGIQKQITVACTVMGRNLETAGFVERTIYNAQKPKDADGNEIPYRAGAGMTVWLYGIPDKDGKITPPSQSIREPSQPDAFTKVADALTWAAHSEARQLHVLMTAGANLSGESRRQAAADFEASLMPTAKALEAAIRWLLETAYAYALYLRGATVPDGLRVAATCTLSAGIVPIEELRELREGYAAGLLSEQRYQSAAGVEDTEAEQSAMDADDDQPMEDTPNGEPDPTE